MLSTLPTSLFFFSSLTSVAFGHSMVQEIWANGVHYNGWDPNGDLSAYPNTTPGWYTTNTGGGPVNPVDARNRPIICAPGGSNANFSAPVAPGTDVRVRWFQAGQSWPRGHHGPIINYIAACNGPCSTVDMTTLKFVKISQKGWIDATSPGNDNEGNWATDELIANDGQWTIRIPSGLKAGEYVLRHELIALHVAFTSTGPYSATGAEFYPQCVSLKVTGSGTKTITGGVDARTLYTGAEPGLTVNIHTSGPSHPNYVIPGPAIWSGALSARSFEA
ncbi:lytic polysaccharide monooxygenase [Periconia macrospinosa]|uniref:Lytic polysaccharide monooxygenase n=1 Tax=Periconia macrospinosa TaxID=97972 RepID=A0A2V1DBT2_9PLEO|nr:lytic polysaccharide monooxygenase [Periconia macrospinosa]